MIPVLFTIGSFNVYAFGFFLALAFLLSTFIIWKFARDELKEEEYLDAFLYTSVFALFSSRLTYILFHFDEFGANFLRYVVVRETPGLSLLGGLLGGFLFLFFFARGRKYHFLHILDLFSLAFCFALLFAKIGEQLGGAGFGKETTFPISIGIAGVPGRHHPVELYYVGILFLCGILLLFLYQKIQRDKWPYGLVFSVFAFVLALSIFVLEFLTVHPVYLYGLNMRQITALIGVAVLLRPLYKRVRSVFLLKKEKHI